MRGLDYGSENVILSHPSLILGAEAADPSIILLWVLGQQTTMARMKAMSCEEKGCEHHACLCPAYWLYGEDLTEPTQTWTASLPRIHQGLN